MPWEHGKAFLRCKVEIELRQTTFLVGLSQSTVSQACNCWSIFFFLSNRFFSKKKGKETAIKFTHSELCEAYFNKHKERKTHINKIIAMTECSR